MVWKLQIRAAAMNIKAFTQCLAAHGRAFNMPARAPYAKVLAQGRTVPFSIFGFELFRGFPQNKIKWVLFPIEYCHAFPRAQLIQRFARQFAIARKFAYRIVHITSRRLVCQSFGLKLANQTQHVRHIFRRTRFYCGRLNSQLGNVYMHRINHLVGECTDGDATLHSPFDDFVVNIRDIAHIGHPIPADF